MSQICDVKHWKPLASWSYILYFLFYFELQGRQKFFWKGLSLIMKFLRLCFNKMLHQVRISETK